MLVVKILTHLAELLQVVFSRICVLSEFKEKKNKWEKEEKSVIMFFFSTMLAAAAYKLIIF